MKFLLERAQSKFDDDVRVTAAVLSAEESRQIFGVGPAKKRDPTGLDPSRKPRQQAFFLPVPGIKADDQDVDCEKLYTRQETVDLDENELRIALENLPCCTTNEDGTQQGDPLNLTRIYNSRRPDTSASTAKMD